MLTSIIYTTLNLDEDPVFWNDATAVKEAVERLEDVNMDYFRPLDEIKEQLNINPGRHMEFVEFGGADVTASPHRRLQKDPRVFSRCFAIF